MDIVNIGLCFGCFVALKCNLSITHFFKQISIFWFNVNEP